MPENIPTTKQVPFDADAAFAANRAAWLNVASIALDRLDNAATSQELLDWAMLADAAHWRAAGEQVEILTIPMLAKDRAA